MRSFLAIFLILVCFVDKSYGTFAEFMNNLPTEVANAFSNAWTSITDAIKKPVRLKRLGPGGRLKSTPSYEIGSLPPEDERSIFGNPGATPPSYFRSTTYFGNKLTLPVLPAPKYKNLDDWREMQKAHFAKRKKVANPAPVVIFIEPPDEVTRDKKGRTKPITRYDDESFATMMVLQ
ncbi:uncharacterized protein LOC113495342 [Trichoplusia ni]|uniref:Uncharacterized protein LOC113495342 n=1 Tax=Trichoplusia ni TaxID=7111 RepID=A0A7E5VNS7_TRINI|nr:uncharacterized protein LOC113495342 [Trichoplusia ni]XP_026729826.1 uncharacterized protein LOC113495342 [Trichoplusia ni]XP_026729827.1 uncharacterized protein LOC113495342 [Trichoplusia ni]XP_026729828.1 uncharacterized protein LOC113495342 [Trichoplusia ni]XP_026729829.1 uncharacterized protein LOC113495342 [Trichoplusia ni]